MEIVLQSRAAPADRLRIWVGTFGVTEAPALSWLIDGAPNEPIAFSPIASVRSDDLLSGDPGTISRAFTGVYEFAGLQPDTAHTITLQAGGGTAELRTRTLPAAVPSDIDSWFNVLMVSCHHAAEDRRGLSGTIVSHLKSIAKPQLTLLLGDQVYLDLPTLQNFPDDEVWLAEKFERDYIENWRGPEGYANVLAAAPTVSIPDDHEYWNNYPHPSPFIQNAWNQDGRDRWRKAAQAMFKGFQLSQRDTLGEAVIIDVSPLSFFIADTRSNKDPGKEFTLAPPQHQQLSDWVNRVVAERLFGIFVSGQSLFENRIGSIAGAIADFELPNYHDYGQIMSTLVRMVDAGRPLLCLTGDVHWGRVAAAQDITTGRTMVTEIIASPSSLVTTVGADTFKKIGGFFGSIFGKPDPWPRHSDAAAPPAFLAGEALGGRFPCTAVHNQKGNHVALLSFRQSGGSVECRVTYWPVHPDNAVARPTELGPFQFIGA